MSIIETFDSTTQNILKELEKTQRDFWNICRTITRWILLLWMQTKDNI